MTPNESTLEDRIAARIAKTSNARDQVIHQLIADLKASVAGAEAGLHTGNVALERRAAEVLQRLIDPDAVILHKPAAMGKTTDLQRMGEAVTTAATLLLEAFPDETLRGNQKIGERRAAILNRAILTAKSAFFGKGR